MMTEWDWYESTEKLLHERPRGEWNRLVSRAIEVYKHYKINEEVSDEQIEEALHGLLRKLQGFPPTWIAIAGPDGEIKTPDDIWMEPAWNVVEVQHIWDVHDGRNDGMMVVGVYIWNHESSSWQRDPNWGIMGNEGKRRPANEDNEADRLCE